MIIFGPGKTNEEGGYERISNRELELNMFTYTYTSYSTQLYIVMSRRTQELVIKI